MAYLAFAASSLLVTSTTSKGGEPSILKGPHGEWAGTLDSTGRKAIIFLSHFRGYAVREKLQLNGLLKELETKGVLRRQRVNPGVGHEYNHGQQPCIVVDLKHVDISGHAGLASVGA